MSPKTASKLRAKKNLNETKLYKLRLKKSLSQSDLAKLSGVPLRTIQCYEQEGRPIDGARLNTLCSFANVLDCSIEDILEDEELVMQYKSVK